MNIIPCSFYYLYNLKLYSSFSHYHTERQNKTIKNQTTFLKFSYFFPFIKTDNYLTYVNAMGWNFSDWFCVHSVEKSSRSLWRQKCPWRPNYSLIRKFVYGKNVHEEISVQKWSYYVDIGKNCSWRQKGS